MYVNVLDCLIINSSEFQPSSSPLWERQQHPCLYAHMPTGNHAGTTARNAMQGWQKEKRQRQATDTAAGFWGTKSHSSLGRFLHAPLTLMLKTPQ